ncbi:MAG: ABC transporter substrate-binding protein [Betaproteobacteria bacterium]|nr:ABC transporter substrate-binding protein [Pseudomonadota bacterium]
MQRRDFLKGTSAAAICAASGGWVAPALAQGLRPLRWGLGVKTVGFIVINTLIGESLGYNRAEGFTLDARALGSNSNVQIALDKGDIDVGVGTPSGLLPLFAKGEAPPLTYFYEYTYPYKWDISVKPDSAIKRYEDLRGKKIGVSNFGTTDFPVTKSVLKNLGIDPDKDVTWVAVGEGVPAGVALQRGNIDALAYFDTGFGAVEATGIEMRYLPRPAQIPYIGGFFQSSRTDWLKANQKLAVGFARSTAKASEFILANPEAGARAFLKLYPDAAPKGKSEAEAVKAILYSVNKRMQLFRPYDKTRKMGYILESELKTELEFLGLPPKDLRSIYTNDLIDEINNFDVEKIRAEARNYKG